MEPLLNLTIKIFVHTTIYPQKILAYSVSQKERVTRRKNVNHTVIAGVWRKNLLVIKRFLKNRAFVANHRAPPIPLPQNSNSPPLNASIIQDLDESTESG